MGLDSIGIGSNTQEDAAMSKKLIFGGVVTLVLLALVVSPVLAVPPEVSTYEFGWEFDLVNCREYNKDYKFTIYLFYRT